MTPVLYIGACVGHAVLVMFTLNRFYGLPLPRHLLSSSRKLFALLILAGPFLFWRPNGFGLAENFRHFSFWELAFAGYLVACWTACFCFFPVVTVMRWLRKTPALLLSNHTTTVDVAAHLGYRPYGRSKYRELARLPGNEVFQVDFAERTLVLPTLPPAWDGLTILHLSDLHFIGTPDREFYKFVMDRCRDWAPDLVAVTGDIVDSNKHHRWIVPVLGRLRWGVAAFAILGNHDYWRDPVLVRRRLRRLGMRVLGNCWDKIMVRGVPLVVIGHEGPWFRPPPDLADCPRGSFRLCLSHTPDNLRWARRQGIDLMLSGHNHGGQIRFPLIGSVFVPSVHGRQYDCGLFDSPPTVLHVSRGLAGQQPLRYNCRPEVTRIVLRGK